MCSMLPSYVKGFPSYGRMSLFHNTQAAVNVGKLVPTGTED